MIAAVAIRDHQLRTIGIAAIKNIQTETAGGLTSANKAKFRRLRTVATWEPLLMACPLTIPQTDRIAGLRIIFPGSQSIDA